jgi:uncharacterized protein (TIGR03437 family)
LEIGIGPNYLSKFSADFTQLLFSTYFDPITGLALDSAGFAYVAGPAAYAASQAYIAKIDPTPTAISLDSVLSVVAPASPPGFVGIAPGEVIRILGKNMGPPAVTPATIRSGVLATNVAGVEVTFDGTAVPLLSVSAQEIDLVAPFELATKSTTTIQVQYHEVPSNPVQVAVTGPVLQILGVFNQDFSVNSAANPVKPGSIMTLYLAGAGQTNPPSQDGQVNAPPLAAPAGPIQLVGLNDSNSTPPSLLVTFAGAAPGLAAGIFQVNFVAQNVSSVQLTIGNPNAPIAFTEFNVSVQ